jgi:ATPase subunit of ABC transporter with duplicated ATPase domains
MFGFVPSSERIGSNYHFTLAFVRSRRDITANSVSTLAYRIKIMSSVIAAGVSIGHGPVVLAEGIDLSVSPGRVIGLVGQNGAGKTTLLRVIAGLDLPIAGTIRRAPAATTVGYLAQQVDVIDPDETIGQWLERRTGVAQATHAMEAAASALATGDPLGDTYADHLDTWLALGGADFEDRVPAALAGVGLHTSKGVDELVLSLSGGQRARVALAALYLARFDVFCLDEPTNDLDLAGLAQLEKFVNEVRQRPAAVVVVSHDRAFLEAVTTDVLEIDGNERRSQLFGGGFAAFLQEREVARQHAREAFEEYRERHDDLTGRAKVTREWASKGVRNARADLKKKGADPDKIGRKFKADASEKQAGKASRLEKQAERLDEVIEPRKVWNLSYVIAAAPRSGAVVATFSNAVVDRGTFRLGPITTELQYGDRVSVTGPNGAGKSTLLSLLLGQLSPTDGSVQRGSGVVVGELDQARIPVDGDATLVDAFLQWYPGTTIADARTLLAKFGLSGDDVVRPARLLSPGERTRATLARFQHEGVNLLVLDEPTNHLDLPAIEQLEQALAAYPGTLLLVSHDRRLLESVRVNRRWRVDGGVLTDELV